MFLVTVFINECACFVVQTLSIQNIKYPIYLKDPFSACNANSSNVFAKCQIVGFGKIKSDWQLFNILYRIFAQLIFDEGFALKPLSLQVSFILDIAIHLFRQLHQYPIVLALQSIDQNGFLPLSTLEQHCQNYNSDERKLGEERCCLWIAIVVGKVCELDQHLNYRLQWQSLRQAQGVYIEQGSRLLGSHRYMLSYQKKRDFAFQQKDWLDHPLTEASSSFFKFATNRKDDSILWRLNLHTLLQNFFLKGFFSSFNLFSDCFICSSVSPAMMIVGTACFQRFKHETFFDLAVMSQMLFWLEKIAFEDYEHSLWLVFLRFDFRSNFAVASDNQTSVSRLSLYSFLMELMKMLSLVSVLRMEWGGSRLYRFLSLSTLRKLISYFLGGPSKCSSLHSCPLLTDLLLWIRDCLYPEYSCLRCLQIIDESYFPLSTTGRPVFSSSLRRSEDADIQCCRCGAGRSFLTERKVLLEMQLDER